MAIRGSSSDLETIRAAAYPLTGAARDYDAPIEMIGEGR